jgi:hypothetical protein
MGSNFLALLPSQIVMMKLTEDAIFVEDFRNRRKKTGESTKDPDNRQRVQTLSKQMT